MIPSNVEFYSVIRDPDGHFEKGCIGIRLCSYRDGGHTLYMGTLAELSNYICPDGTLDIHRILEDGDLPSYRWHFPRGCVEPIYPNKQVVRTSSSGYINNSELDENDKEIIRTAIQNWKFKRGYAG